MSEMNGTFPEMPEIPGTDRSEPGVRTIEFVPHSMKWSILSVSNQDGDPFMYMEFQAESFKMGVFIAPDGIDSFLQVAQNVGEMVKHSASMREAHVAEQQRTDTEG